MKIGVVSLGMAALPLDGVLGNMVAAGAEALEINGRETVHQGLWAPPIDYLGIQRQIGAGGVLPVSLGGYCNLAQMDERALAEEVRVFLGYCDLAREMQIPVVRAFTGEPVEGVPLERLYPRIVEGLKEIADQASEWGLRIGVENHGSLMNDGDLLAALLHDVDSPAIGLTLDTGNFCWAGHSLEAAHRFFEKLARHVVCLHVKDGRFQEGTFTFLPAGRGDVDLKGLLRLLAEEGYRDAVLSEYEGDGDYLSSTTESVAYLRGLRDGLL